MSDDLQKVVSDKMKVIEQVMEMFEHGAEVIASTVGQLFPVFEVAAPLVKLALENMETREVQYTKVQLQMVSSKLDVISDEVQNIGKEIEKSKMDIKYFTIEEALQTHFRKFMDILNSKPQYRSVKKDLFLDHFVRSGGEKNLLVLHDAVMGDNLPGESVLDIALHYEERSRRVMEGMCARLKELFCVGLIALMGYAAITGDDEEALVSKWNDKTKNIENKMKSVIDECIANFAEQAQIDTEKIAKEKLDKSNQQFANYIHEFLKKKYDWVKWAVLVYNHSSSHASPFQSKEKYHAVIGKSHLGIIQLKDVSLIVSYSDNPQVIDTYVIKQLMESQDRKSDAVAVAEFISEHIPSCVVHVVSRYRGLWGSWSFFSEYFYWENHKNVTLCVHSE
ncbi:protein rapunzel-like [Protopterus annectens]|uniref:protein rapunzel-like n=1 Tax=Protopterus annectens TaxID=7888 RepID=UPI001CF98076|nr:protein rapunzel-like [Protopterus annectens]